MNAPAIQLNSVSKRYGSKTVIHDLSFDVRRGEIVGFLGPNGAGKTTTMRMIAGYITASTGTVTVAGFDMARQNAEAARHIGYLPEHPPLYDALDVATYLRFVATVKGIARGALGPALDRSIIACGLQDVVHREIFKLSKGYRQRLGLAQALLGDPDVLLLDEPTAGLDPGQIHDTREVIRLAGEACAVLLSTHILHEVTLICHRVAIINQGRLLAIDSPDGLRAVSERTNSVELEVSAPRDALREELLGQEGVHAVDVQVVPGHTETIRAQCQVDAIDGIEARIARAVAARWPLHRLERRQSTLENVFLRYVSDHSSAASGARVGAQAPSPEAA